MSYFEMDTRSMEKVTDTIMRFSDGREAERIINDYLAGEGGDLLKESIHEILPVSGRTWAGKKTAAKATDPFKKTPGNLSVKIHTKGNYHYLYFPDDGSDTIHHYGNKQFMFDGASKKSEEIGDKIIEKLLERLEE